MDIDTQLLLAFIRAQGAFLSGEQLADSLGLSRVSVHNHLEGLRKDGFQFNAIRNKGYQLAAEPDRLHPVLMDALLANEPCPFFKSHLVLGDVDSTNTAAESELSVGRETPFFVTADTQTAGRGRRGRVWHSPRHRNLYLSVALRPSLPPSRLQTITLWLGLRMCQFLRDAYGLPVLVKWPNDLMLHGRKIAGMLTEARVDSESTRDLVFGIGLNVNSSESDFPPDIASMASSLALNLGHSLNINRLAHSVVLHLAEAMQDFLDNQFADELARLWPEFDFLRGQHVETDLASGTAIGITSSGSLRVEREDGSIAILHSGEVSLKKQ
jgi:BirA family biotin operon repressor/biotin-[acetyl-CoA-carboxylase] ligase